MFLNEMHVKQEIRDRERQIRQRICEQQHESRVASVSVRRSVGRSIM